MLVQPIDKKRNPARTRLEEGHPQLRMALEDAAGNHRGHRRHLVKRKADAVHLNVIRETVYPDLGQMNAGRPMHPQRHPEFDGGGIERVEVGVVEVACLERRRHQSRHQPKVFGFGHDIDRQPAMFYRSHRDAAEPPARSGAVIGDPLVVEASESGREFGILETRRAQAKAGIEHHRVDVIAVGVTQHAFGRPAVDIGRATDPVFGRAARARTAVLGVVASFEGQPEPPMPAGSDVLRPPLDRFDCQ